MGQTNIDEGNELHAANPVTICDDLSGDTDAVSTLDRNKTLPDFFLEGIEGIAAHVIQRFL